jgi:hypothetical protein
MVDRSFIVSYGVRIVCWLMTNNGTSSVFVRHNIVSVRTIDWQFPKPTVPTGLAVSPGPKVHYFTLVGFSDFTPGHHASATEHHHRWFNAKLENLIVTTIPYHCPLKEKSIWLDRGSTIQRQTRIPWIVLHHVPGKDRGGRQRRRIRSR